MGDIQPPEMPGKLPEATPLSQPAEASVSPNPEKNLSNLPSVRVEGDRLGHLLILPRKTVELADIFPDGKESYPEIYMRSASGNIYQIEKIGDELVLRSAKDVVPRPGRGIGFETHLKWKDNQAKNRLTIGDPFLHDPRYPVGGGNTSLITEAVIVESEVIRDPNRLQYLTPNSIVENFNIMVTQGRIGQAPQGT